jgi:HAD superfamily hydrolase (TIGR01509 family)
MRAIVFDSDGVLVDSMPSHFKAWKIAFKDVCNSEVDKRTIYLFEGMRGIDLVKSVFELKKYHFDNNEDMKKYTERVIQRKDEVFREILLSSPPKAYPGVRHLIRNLVNCKKAVVSGSARRDVEMLLEKSLGDGNLFDALVTADDGKKGKPDPSAFMNALDKIKIAHSKALIAENAPLGVKAANNAAIPCIVILNNTPLNIQDFRSIINEDRIFKDTSSAAGFIKEWCNCDTKQLK